MNGEHAQEYAADLKRLYKQDIHKKGHFDKTGGFSVKIPARPNK